MNPQCKSSLSLLINRTLGLICSPSVTRKIVGYKQDESEFLLKFLYDHIALGEDFHIRAKWAPKTVVVWDVRTLIYTLSRQWSIDDLNRIAWRRTPRHLIGIAVNAAILPGSLPRLSARSKLPSLPVPKRVRMATVRHELPSRNIRARARNWNTDRKRILSLSAHLHGRCTCGEIAFGRRSS